MEQDFKVKMAYTQGKIDMRNYIVKLIKAYDETNAENIKQDPRLASFLLLELVNQLNHMEIWE